jgi:hypothetical protein
LPGADQKVPPGYRVLVMPEKASIHPAEEVAIKVRVEKTLEGADPNDPMNSVGVNGQLVEITKVTGLRDGKIAPEEKALTDFSGFANFKYTAGQHDRRVTVEFRHVYYIRYPKPSRTFTGKAVITVTPYDWEGTISLSDSMKAGEGGSVLSELTPGGKYDLSKNWTVRVSFKPSASYETDGTYKVDKAELLEFKDQLDQTMFKMEREGRRVEGKAKETAEASGRPLSAKECDLLLQVDPEKGTYFLTGKIAVKGISGKGEGQVEIRVKPVDEQVDEDSEGTSEIDREITISGEFKPDAGKVPERLKGSKDLLAEVPEEMQEFMESLGGKQEQVLNWDLKRK